MHQKKKKGSSKFGITATIKVPCPSAITRAVPPSGLFQSAWIPFPFDHQHPCPRWAADMRRRTILWSPTGRLHLRSTTWSGATRGRKSCTSFTFPLYPCLAAREAVSKYFEPTGCGRSVTYVSHQLHITTRPTAKARWRWGELGRLLGLGSTRVSCGLSPLCWQVFFKH